MEEVKDVKDVKEFSIELPVNTKKDPYYRSKYYTTMAHVKGNTLYALKIHKLHSQRRCSHLKGGNIDLSGTGPLFPLDGGPEYKKYTHNINDMAIISHDFGGFVIHKCLRCGLVIYDHYDVGIKFFESFEEYYEAKRNWLYFKRCYTRNTASSGIAFKFPTPEKLMEFKHSVLRAFRGW